MTRRGVRIRLLAAVGLAFVVGANIAWLNPDPEAEAFRPSRLPILWQYDADAGVEVVSAAYFPDAFLQYPERISRPGYPAAVNVLGRGLAAIASPLRPLTPLEAAGAGYLLLKLMVVTAGCLAAFDLLRRYVDERAALLGAMLLVLHPLVLEYSTTFHTTELQLIGAVLVLRGAAWAVDRHDRRAAVGGDRRHDIIDAGLVGLAAGLLMLAKPVLVAPLALLAALVVRGRRIEAGVATLAFVAPQAAAPLLLEAAGVPYRNWEVEEYGQGVWLLETVREGPTALASETFGLLPDLVVAVAEFHGVLLLLAVLSLWSGWVRLDRRAATVVVLMALASVSQFIAVRRTASYMTADLGLVVFGAAAAAIIRGLDALTDRRERRTPGSMVPMRGPLPRGAGVVVGLWLASGLAVLGNLPWVAPWDQPGRDPAVLDNRLDILENPDRYSPEDRARARGGVIIGPAVEVDAESGG